ncbi:non-specific lipid transfer protein GPI-anchored 3-like isoform X2 [Nymphaea colorata]|uniref:non-specific lipid transfer protein GPI-anchored 3-like isoform X2 n=1 Tax=Nymphaea colorata TaxID=210225 RepID=UPI00129E8FB2|nr:non-specific lipid transfer protein GPI-anchored 3-like isoform X2 [Nymphaea colorata]
MESRLVWLALVTILLLAGTPVGRCADGGGGSGGPPPPVTLRCLQSLIPCQPYLRSSASPPVTCCGPLTQALRDEVQCLCQVFNNEQLLQSLNVSKSQALELPKRCGSPADLSLCQKNGTSASSPSSKAPGPSTSNADNQKSSGSKLSIFMDAYILVALCILSLQAMSGAYYGQ